MYKLCFYVPVEHCEAVKTAVFNAGAGKLGAYDSCAWQVLGEGQFRPLAGSNPHLGEENKVETVPEYKVEMVCDSGRIIEVIAALKAAHPYEEPAYQVYRLDEFEWG